MLVLTRKIGESIVIGGGDIVLRVVAVNGARVKVGIVAPADVPIMREEIAPHSHPMRRQAPTSGRTAALLELAK